MESGVNCLTARELVGTNTLFTEDLAQFERFEAADRVATATPPDPMTRKSAVPGARERLESLCRSVLLDLLPRVIRSIARQ
jgi:hypothetical protein